MAYRKHSRRANVTLLLVTANIIAYFAILYLGIRYGEAFIVENIAITPSSILAGNNLWTIFTSMFAHFNPMHLFVNMASLFFVGSFLESLIGHRRFFLLYIISGIIASLFFVFLSLIFTADFNVPAVGASGAIFGIAGVLTMLTPRASVLAFFIIPMPLWFAMVLFLAGFWIVSLILNLPIGNTAHLGGFVTGFLYGFYLRRRYRKKVAMLDRYFR